MIGKVVNREQRCHRPHGGTGVERPQVDWRKPGLPIVRMEQIVRLASGQPMPRVLNRGPREKPKPSRIVRIVAATLAVDGLPVVEIRPVDKHHAHSLSHRLLDDPGRRRGATKRHLNGDRRSVGLHTAIFGDDKRDAMSKPRERQRKSAKDVSQAAGFGKRQRFRPHHQDRQTHRVLRELNSVRWILLHQPTR